MQKVYYCAWCKHIKNRKKGVFYSSRICKKHLLELKQQTYEHLSKNNEDAVGGRS